ncbi:MAG TPA: glycosyltransferase family 4 protein [Phycisphaerae bacterium]|nr:glycosyltransferase family 4 protein [Phycisphaerae bacterium]
MTLQVDPSLQRTATMQADFAPDSSDVKRGTRPLRVLLISHTCQSPTEGQPKPERIATMPGIELVTLIPDRWKHYGKWRTAATVPTPRCRYEIGKVALPWTGPGQFYLHWYPGLKRLLREFQPDVIDLWEEPWALVSAQAVRLRNRMLPRCRVITETEQNINRKLPAPFEQFRKYVLKHADYAVCRNMEAESVLRAKGYRGEATVVPNAVDDELFRPLDREMCRKHFGFSGFTVGYIGRFVERKGIQDLIAAVARCPGSVRAVLVGSGDYQPALEKRIAELDAGSRVRIIPQVAASELTPIMNAIDALVLPSRTVPTWKEQFGRVIIEAHACETPVIGSDSGAIPEVVGTGGRIFAEGDVGALAAAITDMAGDPAGTRHMGAAGKAQVHEKYTWQKVAERMYSIYLAVGKTPRQERHL